MDATQPLPEIDDAALAEALTREGLLAPEAMARARAAAGRAGTGLDRALLELGLVPEEGLYRLLAIRMGLPFVEPGGLAPSVVAPLAAELALSPDFLVRTGLAPMARDEGGLLLATGDLDANEALRAVAYHTGLPVRAALATPAAVRAALEGMKDVEVAAEAEAHRAAAGADVERLRAAAEDGPVITLVNDLVASAVEARASDIHIEALEAEARVRLRVDGTLRTLRTIPDGQRAAVASRLKVMANLNIAERRRPQDGRAQLVVRGLRVDLRLSTLPTQWGESLVLRILDRAQLALDWDALGFAPERVAALEGLLAQPNGIVLVAGPTGSGKTTTLYTALARLNTEERKIVTVEDPVEVALAGINQVQVEPRIDMTFAAALRAILRQDPDVVMVGEIRDEETAEIATRAALVGRLVLSTVHTNDAVSAVDRLADLGVPRYLIAATLRGVLSQRLVRRLCEACRGAGCEVCADTGRRGRRVVGELLTPSPAMMEAIAAGARGTALLDHARAEGFVTLREEGRALAAQGLVTAQDIDAVA